MYFIPTASKIYSQTIMLYTNNQTRGQGHFAQTVKLRYINIWLSLISHNFVKALILDKVDQNNFLCFHS